jgi:hypothetical protein
VEGKMILTKEDLTRLSELLTTLKTIQDLEEALTELMENMFVFPSIGLNEEHIQQLASLKALAGELRLAIESTISMAGSDIVN